jgi:hypothetical protein
MVPGLLQGDRQLGLVCAHGMGSLSVRSMGALAVVGCTGLALRPGESVSLVFEEQQQHAGSVRWVRARLIGIEFAVPLSPALMQGRIAGQIVPREPRFDIARHALIQHNGAIWDGVIRNVSRNGMLIDSLPNLSTGSRVRIGCGAMAVISAVVRWVHYGQAGVRLVEPIDPTCFGATTAGAALNTRM